MKIWSRSLIDKDGNESILIHTKEPRIGAFDLWEGGELIEFRHNHKKQETSIHSFVWVRGVCHYVKHIKTFKHEILADCECEKFAEEYARGN